MAGPVERLMVCAAAEAPPPSALRWRRGHARTRLERSKLAAAERRQKRFPAGLWAEVLSRPLGRGQQQFYSLIALA